MAGRAKDRDAAMGALLGGALALVPVTAMATGARAEERSAPASVEDAAPPTVRLSLSKQAEAFLTEGRMRRLIDLELPSTAKLAEEATGPLDENAVRVYIDLPEPAVVTIQVVAPQRKVETRRVDVAGLAWDVAARVTAVAASESVRSELEPVRRRTPKPHEPTDDELASMFRHSPAISVEGGLAMGWLPSVATLFGARMGLGFHQPIFSEEIALEALGGDGPQGTTRWLGASVALTHRVYFLSRLRSEVGASFAFAHVAFRGTTPMTDAADLNVRASAIISLDARLVDHTWVSLRVEPGGVLLDAPKGVQGAWLGLGLAVSTDMLLPTAASAEARVNGNGVTREE